MRFDQDGQTGGGRGDAALGQVFAKTIDGSIDSLLGCLAADAEDLSHPLRRLALEVAEHDGIAIRLAQDTECIIQMRRDLFPGGVGLVSEQFIHDRGLLFTGATALDGAHRLDGDILCRAMQPTRQHRTLHQLGCVTCEGHENGLGHVLCQVRITDHSQRSGIDQIHVPPSQFGKGVFRALFQVSPQQL